MYLEQAKCEEFETRAQIRGKFGSGIKRGRVGFAAELGWLAAWADGAVIN